jgi:hypothetical protein
MIDGNNENFEIGQSVFKEPSTSNGKNRAFIKDATPPLSHLTFMHQSKMILDKWSDGGCKIWKFREFKKYCNDEIEREYTYQKELRALKNRLIQDLRFNEATDGYMEASLIDSDLRIKDLEKKLARMKVTVGEGKSYDIAKIKQIPITNYIDFNKGGFAKCIFHSPDKTPSMKYYPKNNTVHCFSCGKSGDVIDVFGQLNSCDFKTAIYQLAKTI